MVPNLLTMAQRTKFSLNNMLSSSFYGKFVFFAWYSGNMVVVNFAIVLNRRIAYFEDVNCKG